MFSHYHAHAQRKAKLAKLFDERQRKANEDIFIRDIIVQALRIGKISYGEFYTSHPAYLFKHHKKKRMIARLYDHIEYLAHVANRYHEKYYCNYTDGSYEIKPDCLNKITRLSLAEYSLFTNKPLSLDDYKSLIERVIEIAKKQHSNVHLLLSSIAVYTEQGILLNTVLYVQCGPDPIVEAFSKGSKSPIDLEYANTTIFERGNLNNSASIIGLASTMANPASYAISNNSVFKVKTVGGAEYLQAVEICLDHSNNYAKFLIEAQANLPIEHDEQPTPKQVDQAITSNSVLIYNDARISTSLVHIDPGKHVTHMNNDVVTANDIQLQRHLRKRKYRNMQVNVQTTSNVITGIEVKNPQFGFGFHIIPQNERRLSEFISPLKATIEQRNQKIKTAFIETHLQTTTPKNSNLVATEENQQQVSLFVRQR